ncbi:DUF1028 domain-containing protein [Halorubrum laminariae]|uniref:DUF1028 domain-containing protein n=1 Tax=Halorubrum laminariae TaxID=1433523 RepID=A0ABD6C2X9_9EURY|nr:DUF1028 domain-containing protein [Halorubrum laminariae]
MTFSICVRERYTDDSGSGQIRYGVAATARIPGVGTVCPFASVDGTVAIQSFADSDLGRKGIAYLADGLAIDDALRSLLNADDDRETRQVHGVGADGVFAFTGDECRDWSGHVVGENFTVAGNLVTDAGVVEDAAAAYESSAHGDAPLAARLIDAIAAGHDAGGDRRQNLSIQSAALLVTTTKTEAVAPYYNDLRVDATETPITSLRETYEAAKRGYEAVTAKYAIGSDSTE